MIQIPLVDILCELNPRYTDHQFRRVLEIYDMILFGLQSLDGR